MSLVRVNDAAENAFIAGHVGGVVWTGANDQSLEGFWQWAQPGTNKGDPFAPLGAPTNNLFSNWKTSEPDNAWISNCGTLDPSTGGTWGDLPCGQTAGFVCEVAPDACGGLEPGAAWPSFRHCAAREGQSGVLGAQTADLNWTLAVAGTTPVGSPVVAADGTVYVAAGAQLVAVSGHGVVKWTFTAGAAFDSTPVVASDGKIYITGTDGHLYGLTASGIKVLDRALEHASHSSPIVGADGTIYAASGDDLQALAGDGTQKWRFDTSDMTGLSPAITRGGTIYVGTRFPGNVAALGSLGQLIWAYPTFEDVTTTVAVGPDGSVLFGVGSALTALTPAGALKWKVTTGGPVRSSPAVGRDGSVVFGADDGKVRLVDGGSGAQRWATTVNGQVTSSPAVDSRGTTYVGASDGTVFALRPNDGSVLWSLHTGGAITTAPAVGADGTLYVGASDGKLYSIGGGPAPFVNCVSPVGGSRLVALFGYENPLSVATTIPVGSQNQLVPTPSLATATPPTVFEPGRHDAGIWVPMDGASLTWTLRGISVTADGTSPVCDSKAYPQQAPSTQQADPETHGQVAGNLPKPEPYFIPGGSSSFAAPSASLGPSLSPSRAEAAPSGNVGVVQEGLGASPQGSTLPLGNFSANANKEFLVTATNAPDETGFIDFPTSDWQSNGAWSLPITGAITSEDKTVTPMTNVSAAMDQILLAPDMGLLATTYAVRVNDGCSFNGQLDSCAVDDALLIGTVHTPPDAVTCTTDNDCTSIQFCGAGLCRWPDESRWKFVSGHEAGHYVQGLAMGSISNPYLWPAAGNTCPGKHGDPALGDQDDLLDPACGELFCGCEHVEAANGYHCLQSIENASTAALEGFAHFYSSKVWNNPADDDCTFVYYKEFLSPAGCPPGADCHPFPSSADDQRFAGQHGVLQSILPPLPIDCRTDMRWRNTYCPMKEYGTELDWMRFFWNVNTVGAEKSTMPDLFNIYRHACHPSDAIPSNCGDDATCRKNEMCENTSVGWEVTSSTRAGFREGAELNYGLNSPRYNYIADSGDNFGVSLSTN